MDPIKLEVFKNKFISVAEEMGYCLSRTSFSPNIKERRDFSCALFDEQGRMVAQAAHIPVHLGSMPMSVKSVVEKIRMRQGDMVMLNDPFSGGTHLPDITLIAPVFTKDGQILAYVANRAHHADIGGISPGSMTLSSSLFQEGLIIPPVKFVRNGLVEDDLLQIILRNTRTPAERKGDLSAQISANLTGIKRFKELVESRGQVVVTNYMQHLNDYSERIMQEAISKIPDGDYSFLDYLDDDGFSTERIRLKVLLNITSDQAFLDFSGSSDQVFGSVNATPSITRSAVMYVFRCLIPESVPTNDGCMAPISIRTRCGSVLNPRNSAAVASGNVETSQRIVDVVLGALSMAMEERLPAASQGTMNNISIGGIDTTTGRSFSYYETIGGGTGASARADGEHAIHSHMTNTMNTPVEALEFSYPLRVQEYSIRRGSGGRGHHRGGNGVVRELKLLCDAQVTVLSERRVLRPYGLSGGEHGKCGMNTVIKNNQKTLMPGKFSTHLQSGDIIRIETPGGGGYGSDGVTLTE